MFPPSSPRSPSLDVTTTRSRAPQQSDAGRRAQALVGDLWAGRTPANVRLVATGLGGPLPESLAHALPHGAAAVNAALCGDPANLPQRVADYGSGGSHVHEAPPEVAAWMEGLFDRIAALPLGIRVSPQDLYHGHLFACAPGGAAPRGGELGILFHAKEHPEDIPDGKGQGSGFRTTSPSYGDRNLLYLASTDSLYVIDPVRENRVLLSNLDFAPFAPPELHPDRVKAVDASPFYELGARLPDVNLLPRNLAAPRGERVLFMKAYDAPDPEALPAPPRSHERTAPADGFDRAATAQQIAKAFATRVGPPCATEARRKDRGPDVDPGTGAGGLGGTFDLVSIRCLR